jgi:hypothetical protein
VSGLPEPVVGVGAVRRLPAPKCTVERGIVAEQAHCDIRAAFRLLIAASAAKGRGVTDTALEVIDGIIHFVEDAPASNSRYRPSS